MAPVPVVRLDQLPESGRVIVASNEALARYAAFEYGLPYFLDTHVPDDQARMHAVGRLYQLESEWLGMQEPSSEG